MSKLPISNTNDRGIGRRRESRIWLPLASSVNMLLLWSGGGQELSNYLSGVTLFWQTDHFCPCHARHPLNTPHPNSGEFAGGLEPSGREICRVRNGVRSGSQNANSAPIESPNGFSTTCCTRLQDYSSQNLGHIPTPPLPLPRRGVVDVCVGANLPSFRPAAAARKSAERHMSPPAIRFHKPST